VRQSPELPRLQQITRILAALLLAALYAALVYRAATQGITVDEGYIYDRYIHEKPVSEIFTAPYHSANHVLQTLLSYWSVYCFGVSEFAMRLPSVAAALFYIIAAWRIAFLCFRRLGFAILALALLVLNPLVLDHLCLARGYGIGLTFFAWSFYFSLRYLQNRNPVALIPAGVLLGLSLAANLTFAIPGAGLALMTGIFRPLLVLRYYCSALLSAGAVLAMPLRSVHLSDFYFGYTSVKESIVELSIISLFYSGRLPFVPEWDDTYVQFFRTTSYWIVPVLLVGIGVVLVTSFRTANCLRLAAGSLLIAVLFLAIAHQLVGLKYPYDRTGIYLLFLFPLALLAAIQVAFERSWAMRWVMSPVIAVVVAAVVMYGLEFHTGYFAEWPFAPDVKRYMEMIGPRSPDRTVRAGGSTAFTYLINFYRDARHATWLEPVEVRPPMPGYDYYLLLNDDREYVEKFHLRVLTHTDESMLAIRAESP
jgi:Dolichyl-phosphate-mannose-protein mannosyltransferase